MPTSSKDTFDKSEDAMSQIAGLREQVETLMREKAGPAMEAAVEHAEYAAREAVEAVRGRADALAEVVRDRPLIAVGIAVALGYLLGRAGR